MGWKIILTNGDCPYRTDVHMTPNDLEWICMHPATEFDWRECNELNCGLRQKDGFILECICKK